MSSRWQNLAPCASLPTAEADALFHPPTPHGKYLEQDVTRAKEFCVGSGCTVRAECLELGLDVPHGIYGGVGPDERKTAKEQRAKDKRDRLSPPKFARSTGCPEPGRTRSVRRHIALGQRFCLPCALFEADQVRGAELDQVVFAKAAEGHSAADIAKELGLPRELIASVVKKYKKREAQQQEVAA